MGNVMQRADQRVSRSPPRPPCFQLMRILCGQFWRTSNATQHRSVSTPTPLSPRSFGFCWRSSPRLWHHHLWPARQLLARASLANPCMQRAPARPVRYARASLMDADFPGRGVVVECQEFPCADSMLTHPAEIPQVTIPTHSPHLPERIQPSGPYWMFIHL